MRSDPIMHCPWDFLPQSSLKFCEVTLCAWVKEPANTWSNFGYLIVGVAIVRDAARTGRTLLRTIGLVSILTGIGSAFYHASGSYWGSIADYSAMFMGTALMTALNVQRWLHWPTTRVYFVLIATLAAMTGMMLRFPGTERILYSLVMPCCAIELRLYFRDRGKIEYRSLLQAWLCALVGVAFWWLDVSRSLCWPQNHVFTGHSLWHLGTALAFWYFYRFYSQFKDSPV